MRLQFPDFPLTYSFVLGRSQICALSYIGHPAGFSSEDACCMYIIASWPSSVRFGVVPPPCHPASVVHHETEPLDLSVFPPPAPCFVVSGFL